MVPNAPAAGGAPGEQQEAAAAEPAGVPKSEGSVAVELVGIDEIVEAVLEELSKEQVFHGSVPIADLVPLLKENGDFLIRTADDQEGKKEKIHIMILVDKVAKHFPFKISKTAEGERQITLDGTNNKPKLMELIKFHKEKMVPVQSGTNIKLWRAVPRVPWELGKDKLTLGKELGSGANGVVRAGVLKFENKPINVAVKVTKMSAENKTKITELLEEARLMRQLKHNNVVAFYGVVLDQHDAMIVMELVIGGGLDSHIKKNPKLSIEERCSYIYDVACGLYYLHHCRFIHRDVACRNCLIDVATNVVKISDFGMSKKSESYKIGGAERTPIRWQAPEVLTKYIYTRECDVFSFGMVCYEILTGLLPHQNYDIKVIRKRIVEEKFRPPIGPNWPPEVQGCVWACWAADPKKRPPMQDTLPFLRKFRRRPGDPPLPLARTPGTGTDSGELGKPPAQRQHTRRKVGVPSDHAEKTALLTRSSNSTSRNPSIKRKPVPKNRSAEGGSKAARPKGSTKNPKSGRTG